MADDEEKSKNDPGEGISQIPLLHEMVFNPSLPLKPPPRPRKPRLPVGDHGPDYDPGTLDLFEDTPPASDQAAVQQLRSGASRMIDELVEEYSAEITLRLKEELVDQLGSILNELIDSGNEHEQDGEGTENPD